MHCPAAVGLVQGSDSHMRGLPTGGQQLKFINSIRLLMTEAHIGIRKGDLKQDVVYELACTGWWSIMK